MVSQEYFQQLAMAVKGLSDEVDRNKQALTGIGGFAGIAKSFAEVRGEISAIANQLTPMGAMIEQIKEVSAQLDKAMATTSSLSGQITHVSKRLHRLNDYEDFQSAVKKLQEDMAGQSGGGTMNLEGKFAENPEASSTHLQTVHTGFLLIYFFYLAMQPLE